MTPEHLDDDELVTLCDVLRWAPDAWLTHLTNCPACRGVLREIAGLHDAFAPATAAPSLVAGVQGVIAAAARRERAAATSSAPSAPPRGRSARLPLARVGTGLLAGSTAFAALSAFGMVNPLTTGVLAPAAVLGLVVGAVAARPGALRRIPHLTML